MDIYAATRTQERQRRRKKREKMKKIETVRKTPQLQWSFNEK